MVKKVKKRPNLTPGSHSGHAQVKLIYGQTYAYGITSWIDCGQLQSARWHQSIERIAPSRPILDSASANLNLAAQKTISMPHAWNFPVRRRKEKHVNKRSPPHLTTFRAIPSLFWLENAEIPVTLASGVENSLNSREIKRVFGGIKGILRDKWGDLTERPNPTTFKIKLTGRSDKWRFHLRGALCGGCTY